MIYIKKFNTHNPEYLNYMSSSDKVLPNLSYCEDVGDVHLNIKNVIIYFASSKLPESTSSKNVGIMINSFNTTIKSHTFEDGKGIIEFDDVVTTSGQFNRTENVTKIILPRSVTTIVPGAF